MLGCGKKGITTATSSSFMCNIRIVPYNLDMCVFWMGCVILCLSQLPIYCVMHTHTHCTNAHRECIVQNAAETFMLSAAQHEHCTVNIALCNDIFVYKH